MKKAKRILLVNPPNVEQGGFKPCPLALLYLAGFARSKNKHLIFKVIDGSIDGNTKIKETISSFKPDIIGVTVLTPSRHDALDVAGYAKKNSLSTKVVFGGIHPTIMWRQMMEEYSVIDYIARGEGEEIFYDLISGKPEYKIDGLVWRNKGQIINNKDRRLIVNLDKIPFPAWDLVDPYRYSIWGKGKAGDINLESEIRFPIIFSRGCMGMCTFCSSWRVWRGYRHRSGKNVADEVIYLNNKYNAKHFGFHDDTLTGSRRQMIEFCDSIIKKKLNLAFFGTTRVDQVDYKLLQLMKRAGFYEISYGIESGSPGMLLKINKRTDLKKIFRAARLTKKAGIIFTALMMFGLPNETKQDRKLTQELLSEIKPDKIGTVGEVWIFPGTALYEQAKNAKIINDSFWLGKRPYYIYRGGIGKDPVLWHLRIKDEILYHLSGTFFEKPSALFFIKAERLKNKINNKLKPVFN